MHLVDHVVVATDDPVRSASQLAERTGLTFSAEPGVSDDGHRTAAVPVGRGQYVDFLAPEPDSIDPAADVLRAVPPDTPVAWVLGCASSTDVAARLGLGRFPVTDEGVEVAWLVHWEEAVRSGGLLPCWIEYGPPFHPVWERAASGAARYGGFTRLVVGGDGEGRQRVREVIGGGAVEAVDVPIEWGTGHGLRAVGIGGAHGEVLLGG